MKIAVAMSGGVDSSVAALLTKKYSSKDDVVVGIHLALSKDNNDTAENKEKKRYGCCNIDDAIDARTVAYKLNLPYYIWDFSQSFDKEVVQDFIKQYKEGRTPNPCIRCNEKIKLTLLFKKLSKLGYSRLVTGHYAIINKNPNGRFDLCRAKDRFKDQSYVLSTLHHDMISKLYLPLGHLYKDEVREIAEKENLLEVSKKHDSTDICFIKSTVKDFLKNKIKDAKDGEIMYIKDNRVIGKHNGILGYTVGERKGLNITDVYLRKDPLYVVKIDAGKNILYVGTYNDLYKRYIEIDTISHLSSYVQLNKEEIYEIQIRSHQNLYRGNITNIDKSNNIIRIKFIEPIVSTANGQVLSAYIEDKVIYSGYIIRSFN